MELTLWAFFGYESKRVSFSDEEHELFETIFQGFAPIWSRSSAACQPSASA